MFIGRTDVEAETPILWPPDVRSWLIGKDPDAGKDWGQEVKGTTEDEMVGWHHWFNGHGFGWAPGVGDGQGGLACCGSWGHKESDTTEWLNWTSCQVNLEKHVHRNNESLDTAPACDIKMLLFIIQLLSHVQLFVTPCGAASQACLSTISWSFLKLMSIESVMPSNNLILCHPSPPTLNHSQHQGLFQWVSSSHQVAKVLDLQLQCQSFQLKFRVDFL